ncbi:PREDICTED: thioredoxin domain-containing protein 11 [Dufourea novaeangliae]|uniref:Thioredoxin domain-containing protein 11 n=1 Tax=Dufourea novaeangliae TaxID=178035 RepID=A0A154P1B3_DUFNO|nr:PREDICTED: thioredoxin domain-containing protein 11 [Dufourea novaeangliae]KZC05729.1 Thioredoxin domain-containing protein 11 [Dufourea novaeangliae]
MLKEELEATTLRNADNSHTITPDSGSNDVAKESSQRLVIEDRVASKMFSYAREICFFLAVTFTALTALHSSSPKVSKPPTAKPFFNQSSIVLDFYKGHVGAVIEMVREADFSFVMYYAPWDAESQAVRPEFEKVAQHYDTQVFFAAINCWHPSSECRAQYKIQRYPLLMLYPSRDSGIQYKGIRTSQYMIRFLHAVMNPIVRIIHPEQLIELLVNYDAVVVGYFNFTRLDRTPGYKEFHKAAISALESDPNRELIFAIVTSKLASERDHNIYTFPSANLLMWNESLRYPEDSEWTSENILNWIRSSTHQPALWLQPPGIKALTLAPYLREGPVLFLFTPRNPLLLENYNYNLIREIGLQYYNCADNLLATDIIERLKLNRCTAVSRHSGRNRQCSKILKENRNLLNQSVVSVSIQRWINDSCCANIVMNKCSLCKKNVLNGAEKESSVCKLDSDKASDVCKGADIFKLSTRENLQEKYEICCNKAYVSAKLQQGFKTRSHRQTASLATGNEHDVQSANAVKHEYLKQECKRWIAGNKYHHPIFPRDSLDHPNLNLTKSVCQINKTLALIAIDSLHYFHFAEGLGIDVLKKKDKTAVVILDVAHESQYVMQDDFNRYTLVQFINNYTQGVLQRTLRSSDSRRFAQKFKSNITCETKDSRSICIPELTTETFLDTILDPLKDVVVMYHSPYCAFCSAISYTYLTVAYYLRKMDHLSFVGVDGDNNDLPWEYNMNRFPSILFFPAKRKEDSTVYPFSLPITIPNLVNFVLANLDGHSHVEALVNICQSGAGEQPDACIARTRWLCLDIIEQLLRDYRKLIRHINLLGRTGARNRRKIILLKLAHIKDVHLLLSSTVDLRKDQHKAKLIRKKFKKYYRNIRLFELDSKMNSIQTANAIPQQNLSERTTIRTEL